MSADNIDPAPSEIPEWNAADLPGSLREYRVYVETRALRFSRWYWRRKRAVRLFASLIQYARVVLMSLAAILPIAGQLTGNALLSNALLGCLLVGASAALQAGDQHLGLSSAWVRYVVAATQIRIALEEFHSDWVLLQARTGPQPTARQAEEFLQLAQKFHLTVEGLVARDTQTWATEFRGFSKELDRAG